jgi:hypothetical protein
LAIRGRLLIGLFVLASTGQADYSVAFAAAIMITRPSGIVVNGILSGPADPPLRERRGEAQRHHPLGCACNGTLTAISHPNKATHPRVCLIIRAPPQNCDCHGVYHREQIPGALLRRDVGE